MKIEFNRSKGFAIYFIPTIILVNWTIERELKFSFLIWHITISWRKRK